jgi:heavy metal efflux system protein
MLQSKFKYLLNDDTYFTLFSNNYKMTFDENLDKSTISNQPSVHLKEQEINSNKAEIALEKSKKIPELVGGVYWQTFKSNTILQDNFNGVYGHFGVALPLFNSAIKNKQKALEINTQIAENELVNEKIKLQTQYQVLLQEYKKNKATIDYYETIALKNVVLVANAVNKKFINGDINYIEWVMIINQNTEIQSNYIESIRKGNETIINIMYLTSK